MDPRILLVVPDGYPPGINLSFIASRHFPASIQASAMILAFDSRFQNILNLLKTSICKWELLDSRDRRSVQ